MAAEVLRVPRLSAAIGWMICSVIIIIIIIIFFLTLVKTREGKKLRKVERGLKWKTSPGGPQRENRRAAIRR